MLMLRMQSAITPILLQCQQARRTGAPVPDAQAAVGGAGGQQRAVGRQRQLRHLRAVAQQHLHSTDLSTGKPEDRSAL